MPLIIVNGYGVPKNILNDQSYCAYLIQIFNFLWDKFNSKKLTITLCGGSTDFFPPYKRTEAGEMAKWFKKRIKNLKLVEKWRIKTISTELSALENMLAAKKLSSIPDYYFCEKTREHKMRILARKIFGRKTKVMAIEFDGSAPRYQTQNRKNLEKLDLKYALLALTNPAWRKILKQASIEKIKVLRQTPEKVRATEIDRITRKIRYEYYKKFVTQKISIKK